MKNNKTKIFRKSPWTIMSFPRQDCSIIYDDEKKDYDIYEGLAHKKQKPVNVLNKVKKPTKEIDYWFYMCLLVSSILSMIIATLLVAMGIMIL